MSRAALVALTLLCACAAGKPQPVAIDTRNDACRHCRMIVSNPRVAAQIVAAGEEAMIFDDIGCLRDYLAASAAPPDSRVYVADHRTGTWVDAASAVFTKTTLVSTPMGSGIVAHRDAASRDADDAARGGTTATIALAGAGR